MEKMIVIAMAIETPSVAPQLAAMSMLTSYGDSNIVGDEKCVKISELFSATV